MTLEQKWTAQSQLDRQLWPQGAVEKMGLEKAFLIASGVPPEQLKDYGAKLDSTLQRIVSAAKADKANQPLHLRIHRAMHQVALQKGYKAEATQLQDVLDHHEYNCLSGTALYVLAARRANLMATAYAREGHVMALVFDDAGAHKVETTLTDLSDAKLRASINMDERLLIPP